MNMRKTMLSLAIALGCFSAAAQQAEGTTEYVFQPHWYAQLQFGGQETLGETSFGKLLSPNFQVGGGYNFTPLVGARLSVNAWQSKASISLNNEVSRWKWSYVAPMVDVTFNLTNFIGGFNPTRPVDVNLFAGIGVNIGFDNKEAVAVNNRLSTHGYNVLQDIWDGTKARFTGRFGVAADYRINSNWAVGLELQANLLSDTYNSKHACNADWYFNGYVGVKYTFGTTYTTREIPPCEPVIVYQDRVVEKIVEVPVPVREEVKPIEVKKEEMRRDVFFTISSYRVDKKEMPKVTEIADFLKAHPEATVTITGYADKGTGTKAINTRLSKQRAETVAKVLKTTYGIPASRIVVKTMSYETEDQPFADPVMNRVAICVAAE